ncbi:MAG: diaminopimelate epimerase [Alphaproteobacteria bacterium]|nr:MAG: diaminopimelate epimerase [Alphaproteobacteria bacterium]
MSTRPDKRPFLKMQGLGNDFVIFDARKQPLALAAASVRHLADRKRGIGCDQLIVLKPSDQTDVFMEIWNADGSRVGACGNATRCVGQLLLDETGKDKIGIETEAGLLSAVRDGEDISVNMGPARTGWQDIPLAEEMDTLHVDFALADLADPVCVNMGNPHAVFFVPEAEKIDLAVMGPEIEHDRLFPERVNASVASVSGDTIRLRVWERGAGITDACGTAACAAAVAASRRGLIGRKATVFLDGGPLKIEWLEDGTVQMAGSATLSFTGEVAV